MPSPIGHALAGVAIAWIAERNESPGRSQTLTRRGRPDRADPPSPPEPRQSPRPSETPTIGSQLGTMALVCAVLAVIPDIDLLYRPIHRTATHSVAAAILVTIVAAGVTRKVTGRMSWRIALTCGFAYGSHIVLDWLGADASVPFGIQALWPFSDRWFVSPWALFPGTERRDVFSSRSILINLRALAAEMLIFVPVVAALWVRRTRRIRGRTSVRGDRPRPSA